MSTTTDPMPLSGAFMKATLAAFQAIFTLFAMVVGMDLQRYWNTGPAFTVLLVLLIVMASLMPLTYVVDEC